MLIKLNTLKIIPDEFYMLIKLNTFNISYNNITVFSEKI